MINQTTDRSLLVLVDVYVPRPGLTYSIPSEFRQQSYPSQTTFKVT